MCKLNVKTFQKWTLSRPIQFIHPQTKLNIIYQLPRGKKTVKFPLGFKNTNVKYIVQKTMSEGVYIPGKSNL
jgi:hypothetical protein